jgi:hypothetical protein
MSPVTIHDRREAESALDLLWQLAWWREPQNVARYYVQFIKMLAREQSSPGVQDVLLALGQKVFRYRLRSARKDLAAAIEFHQLERMVGLAALGREGGAGDEPSSHRTRNPA